jgi:hypothetical protein
MGPAQDHLELYIEKMMKDRKYVEDAYNLHSNRLI